MFVDNVKIYIKAGDGGNGAIAFHREKYVSHGGPSGGEVTTDCLIVYSPETDRFRVLTPLSFIGLTVNTLTGQYEISSITYEKELTAAISYVTQAKIPVVWMLQGHGEVTVNAAASLTELLMDNRFITGTSAGTATPFALALIEALKGGEEAKRIADQIVIR